VNRGLSPDYNPNRLAASMSPPRANPAATGSESPTKAPPPSGQSTSPPRGHVKTKKDKEKDMNRRELRPLDKSPRPVVAPAPPLPPGEPLYSSLLLSVLLNIFSPFLLIATSVWIPDVSAPVCYDCRTAFTFLKRRHHCRVCGHVFCSDCSANRLLAPTLGYKKEVRVCHDCAEKYALEGGTC
jgi:hypothetical protein